MRPWLPHYLLRLDERHACLRCGRVGLAKAFDARPCVPCAVLPRAAALPLLAGAFDAQLEAAPSWVRRRALEAGWRPDAEDADAQEHWRDD